MGRIGDPVAPAPEQAAPVGTYPCLLSGPSLRAPWELGAYLLGHSGALSRGGSGGERGC